MRRALPRLFLGSVATAVVRDATCPVMLVRPPAEVPIEVPAVRSFDEDAARAGVLMPRTIGLRHVDVARVIGSVGKAHELGPDFRPRFPSRGESFRYDRVRRSSAGELDAIKPMPPVDLYKLGYGYYVVDGHRRVAAAKELGHDEILANVTEYIPAEDTGARQLFTARRAFERATGLTTVGAARAEHYTRLREMIHEFAESRGIADLREAADQWRYKVYNPLARRIRALRLNRHFPGERSADIFVHLADFRHAEAARLGHEVDWDDALTAFAASVNPDAPQT